MTRARPANRDAGSATIWVLTCCALLVLVAGAATLGASAVLARHRAEAAADLAALAAADRIGTGGDPCAAAASIAADNGTRVDTCRVSLAADGRSGSVVVSVVGSVRIAVVGVRTVRASARAGRSSVAAA